MKRGALLLPLVVMAVLLSGWAAAEDVKTYVDRGVANLEKGAFDQAFNDFNQALKIKPNDASLLDYRGVAHRCKGRDDQAMQDFNQAIRLDPNYARAYRNRAMVYYDRSEFDKSLQDLEKAQSLGYRLDQDFVKMVRRKAAEKK